MRRLAPGILSVILVGACASSHPTARCPEVIADGADDAAAAAPADDQLAQLSRLAGVWRGQGHGEPGDSTVERTYRWTLGGKYLESRNRSTYAPQAANPKGEVHEDVGYVSHDKARKVLVARQFHIEGFVNQYVLESAADGTFVFVSEAIENIPAGFRARETLRLVGGEQLEETFEIAPPGKDFDVYSKTVLTRTAP